MLQSYLVVLFGPLITEQFPWLCWVVTEEGHEGGALPYAGPRKVLPLEILCLHLRQRALLSLLGKPLEECW